MGTHRILIVEDEPDLLRGLALNIGAEGFDVLTAQTGDSGVKTALDERPDLVLLDVMLPGKSGLDVCRELRRQRFDAPIIMLTARAEEVDRVVGLEMVADDYVTKPFGVRELLARIRVRLRSRSGASTGDTLRFGIVEVQSTISGPYVVLRSASPRAFSRSTSTRLRIFPESDFGI